MYDWDDLRVFLAAAREGSLGRAASSLGISVSTASRRLSTLEGDLGAPLFARTPDGLHPTDAGMRVLEAARAVERGALAVEGAVASLGDEVSGTVRVSVPGSDTLELVLLPQLPPLLAAHPGLSLEFDAENRVVDLGRREADLAIRGFLPAAGEELVTRKLRDEPYAIWGSAQYLAQAGPRPLDQHRWVGWADDDLPLAQLERSILGRAPDLRLDGFGTIRSAVALGFGVALLPRTFAVLTPGLRRLDDGPPLHVTSLWLVGHAADRRTPRVRAVWDWLVEAMVNRPTAEQEREELSALQPQGDPPNPADG